MRPTRSLATPKQTLASGHWNVRTMYRGGATAQIARELERYQQDIHGISECPWTGAGRIKLATGQTVIYGGDETLRESGVAIMFNQQAKRSLKEWTPVMPQKDLQNSIAAAHHKQDGSRNDRSGEDQR